MQRLIEQKRKEQATRKNKKDDGASNGQDMKDLKYFSASE
jgi:hypothetical protein